MKPMIVFVMALIAFSSFPVLAQQADASAQQSTSASAAGTNVHQSAAAGADVQRGKNGVQAQGAGSAHGSAQAPGTAAASANGSGYGAAEMRPVNGQLEGKLDAKTAKAGDPVVVKTTQSVKTADGTVIPKGSRLVGHVTDVQAHAKGSEESHMAIQFDRAELKGGQSMAIHSMIQSVSPAASAVNAGGMDSDNFFAGAPAGGGGMAMGGGGRAGGGLMGGGGGLAGGVGAAAGGTVRSVGSVAGNAGAGVGSAANGVVGAGGRVTGSAANLGGSAAGSGVLTAHETGIPGLMLAGDASGAASGTLTASKKNVHLDSGTQMVLGVAAAR